jgi:hypothetical protein
MKEVKAINSKTAVGLMLMGLLVAGLSCGDTGTKGEVTNKHNIDLVLLQDAESEQVYGYLEITRDGQPFNLAAVAVYNDIDTNAVGLIRRVGEGTYSGAFPDYQIDSTRSLLTELVSAGDEFNFRYLVTMPDTFSFQVDGIPNDTVRSTVGTVQLSWTASRYTDGYMVILEPADPASQAAGYREFYSGQATSASIPITAFSDNEGFAEGLYDVWVAAYVDNPSDAPVIPFTLPDGFVDDTSRPGITFRAGGIYLPEKVVLTAVTDPGP